MWLIARRKISVWKHYPEIVDVRTTEDDGLKSMKNHEENHGCYNKNQMGLQEIKNIISRLIIHSCSQLTIVHKNINKLESFVEDIYTKYLVNWLRIINTYWSQRTFKKAKINIKPSSEITEPKDRISAV